MAENSEPRSWLEPSAANALRLVLIAGLILTLAANMPGHLSYDSVIALVEGSTGVRQSWAPAAYAWILGRFDDAIAGTGLYVTASSALLFLSLLALAPLRPRTTWAAPILAAFLIVTPQLMIYQGIVWKDVLFANLSVAAFVALATAARDWSDRRRWGVLAFALAALSLAALVRQQGLIMAVLAAVGLGWTAWGHGWRRALVWGFGGFAAVCVLAFSFNAAIQPREQTMKMRPDAAQRILQHYDILGAKAHDPSLPLDLIARADPAKAAMISANAQRAYSPERVEKMDVVPGLGPAFWQSPDDAIEGQWKEIVLEHPGDYLAHRFDVFTWVLATPVLERCLPMHVGVAGPDDMLKALKLQPGVDAEDEAIDAFGRRFYGTPVLSHLTFAAIAVLSGLALLIRREPPDIMIAAMLVGAVGFAASFFFLSVACDYRYLYILDLAAIAGLLYLAADPPVAALIGLVRRREP